MPYFLQQYKPQEPVTKAHEDGTGGGSNRESPAAISGSSTSHGNQCKRSAVNKIYTLAQKLEVLQYVRTHFEAEAARHFEIPRTTIQGWKGLDRQPIDRKKSRRKSGRTKLKLAAYSHTVKTWRMNYHGEVIIRGTGAQKQQFTVTLTCTALGKMLQPFVTFKAKT